MRLLSWPNWLRHQIYAVMLAVLFAGAFIPGTGEAVGDWHIQMHLAVFAVVSLVSCWAWPPVINREAENVPELTLVSK